MFVLKTYGSFRRACPLVLLLSIATLTPHAETTDLKGPRSPTSIGSLRSLPLDALSSVTIQGSVTRTGNPLFLQDRSGGIQLTSMPMGLQVRIGDELLIFGDAKPARYSYTLTARFVRLLRARTPLPPLAITPGMAASGHYDRVLVDTEGVIRSVSPGSRTIFLESNGQNFAAQFPGEELLHSKIRNGSLIRVRGICVMNETRSDPAVAFQILLRSPQDITILAGPPFWTREHVVLIVLACVVLATFALLLQRRIERWRFSVILDERTRLAYDLHDALAQSFAGIGFQLQAIRSAILKRKNTSEIDEHVHLAIGMVSHSHQDARRAIAMLRPIALTEGGLMPQLRSQAETLTRGGEIEITTYILGNEVSVSREIQNALLGIGHEAITNAVRHANPKMISMSLTFKEEFVSLSVQDDGHGFDPEHVHRRGFGLDGMHARAMSCGGNLSVSSASPTGTMVHASLPLHSNRHPFKRWFNRLPNGATS